MTELFDDGTLMFLPGRLNSQPVIMGGLTADEMWITLLLCSVTGLLAGFPAAILTQIWALIIAGAMVGGVLVLTSLVSRALFYVLVIPTTMPGAFFWKNKGFEQHARDIGLANMPQVGVAPLRH